MRLRFEGGKIVEASADSDEVFLVGILDADQEDLVRVALARRSCRPQPEPHTADLVALVAGRILGVADHALRRVLDRTVEDLAPRHVRPERVDEPLAAGKTEAQVGAVADDPHLARRRSGRRSGACSRPAHPSRQERIPVEVLELPKGMPASSGDALRRVASPTQRISPVKTRSVWGRFGLVPEPRALRGHVRAGARVLGRLDDDIESCACSRARRSRGTRRSTPRRPRHPSPERRAVDPQTEEGVGATPPDLRQTSSSSGLAGGWPMTTPAARRVEAAFDEHRRVPREDRPRPGECIAGRCGLPVAERQSPMASCRDGQPLRCSRTSRARRSSSDAWATTTRASSRTIACCWRRRSSGAGCQPPNRVLLRRSPQGLGEPTSRGAPAATSSSGLLEHGLGRLQEEP